MIDGRGWAAAGWAGPRLTEAGARGGVRTGQPDAVQAGAQNLPQKCVGALEVKGSRMQ